MEEKDWRLTLKFKIHSPPPQDFDIIDTGYVNCIIALKLRKFSVFIVKFIKVSSSFYRFGYRNLAEVKQLNLKTNKSLQENFSFVARNTVMLAARFYFIHHFLYENYYLLLSLLFKSCASLIAQKVLITTDFKYLLDIFVLVPID